MIKIILLSLFLLLTSCNKEKEIKQVDEAQLDAINKYVANFVYEEPKAETTIKEVQSQTTEPNIVYYSPEEQERSLNYSDYNDFLMSKAEQDYYESAIDKFEVDQTHIYEDSVTINAGEKVKLNLNGFSRLKFNVCLLNQDVNKDAVMVINTPGKTISRYRDFKPGKVDAYWVWVDRGTPYITIELVTTDFKNGKQLDDLYTKLVIIEPILYR